MATPVEQIKSRLTIVDVVGSYIKLDKAGSSYKALCPFHQEKSPSFNVSPSRDAYYCFGCNRGGDIFTFVGEIEGVEFVDALKILAARAGVELRHEAPETKSERDRLFAIMEEITVFYEKHLHSNSAVREYLKSRALTDDTTKKFRIGYAPNEWRLASDHLRQKGFLDQEIEKAGLTKPTEGKSPYDRFRGRVMFPIFDTNGRVVAFSGRVFGVQKNQDGTDVAKYINSPETPLYDKGAILFGYDRAKKAIREQNFSILVEGQMDLIMAHQVGTENTVAVSGTALTERHLTLLKRLSDNAVFAFDADEAGLKATARAFHLALAAGMNVRVASIPDGKDPADYIKSHPSEWSKVIASSQHIINFYLEALAKHTKDAAHFRKEVEVQVLPLVMAVRSNIEQATLIIEIARKLGIPEAAVWSEVKRLQSTEQFLGEQSRTQQEASEGHREGATPPKSRRQVAEEEIIGILTWQEGNREPAINIREVRLAYHERMKLHRAEPHEADENEQKALAMKAEYKYEHGPTLSRSIDELLDTLEEEVLREKQAELWKKLSGAELRNEKEEAKAFLQEYQSITPRIIALEDRRAKRGSDIK